MDGQYVFEEIKQKYKISNKYMLCVTYEDIGILIHIIEMLDKQLKYRKEEINIKSNNIDILEEKEKEAIKDLEEYLHWEELQGFSMLPRDKHIETLLNLVSNLIAENKELKEENEGLKTKLDTLIEKYKELKEELDSVKQIYYTQREIEENYILKSKVEEVIEEVKKDENPSISSFQEYAQEYAIDKLQSLLGKE